MLNTMQFVSQENVLASCSQVIHKHTERGEGREQREEDHRR
jgi:hypothetical protein